MSVTDYYCLKLSIFFCNFCFITKIGVSGIYCVWILISQHLYVFFTGTCYWYHDISLTRKESFITVKNSFYVLLHRQICLKWHLLQQKYYRCCYWKSDQIMLSVSLAPQKGDRLCGQINLRNFLHLCYEFLLKCFALTCLLLQTDAELNVIVLI